MKLIEATEQAYKNGYDKGYEDGKKDEVKRGRWITVESREYLGVRCSNCQKWFDEKTNYCPNCGADMRKPPKGE